MFPVVTIVSESMEHHLAPCFFPCQTKADSEIFAVCIATGGYPIVPKEIPGAEYGITNEGFFAIEELPSKGM
jgi:hypothetical protein